MSRYLLLQLKRICRILPLLLCVALVLTISLACVFSNVIEFNNSGTENARFRFGLCGEIEGTYLDIGLTAIKQIDDLKDTLVLEKMTEEEAMRAVKANQISAYVVIPENFAHEAYYGNILPIKYVTDNDSAGITPFLKDELTEIISNAIAYGLQSVYGTYHATSDYMDYTSSSELMNDMSIEYVEYIIGRADVYSVTELGISDNLDFAGYFFCGIAVLLLMLISLPYTSICIRWDDSLLRVLSSKGLSPLKQMLCEYGSLSAGMFIIYTPLCLCIAGSALVTDIGIDTLITTDSPLTAFIQSLPVILMISALTMLICEVSRELISGVLAHFFLTISLCYVSGCLYPIFVFPEAVQKLAAFLPTGIARSHIGNCITQDETFGTALGLLIYCGVFFALAWGARIYRLRKSRR